MHLNLENPVYRDSMKLTGRFSTIFFSLIATAGLAICFSVGCTPKKTDDDSQTDNGSPAKNYQVAVAMVGHSDLGPIIKKQWTSSGHTIDLKVISEADLLDAQKSKLLDFDVVIFPPKMLGTLVSQDCLEPLSIDKLDGKQLRPGDILRIHRQDVVSYGGKTWGVSLGGPTFSLLYRRDVFEKAKLEVPKTWEQYQQVVTKLSELSGKLKDDQGNDLPTKVIEPLADGWGSKLLLLRSASAMCQRGQMENIMKLDDAKPLINAPPFVRSLNSIRESIGKNLADSECTPIEAFQKIATGKAAMALAWPTSTVKMEEVSEHLGVAALPESEELFDVIGMKWATRQNKDSRAVLVGFDGNMASMISRARHQEAAEYFLSWIAGPESASRIWSRSPHCSISRGSQATKPYSWCGENVPRAVGDGYSKVITESNSNGRVLHYLRLPGQAEYMKVLDRIVLEYVRDGKDAQDALDSAANEWEKITDQLGRDKQSKEYRRSSGLKD